MVTALKRGVPRNTMAADGNDSINVVNTLFLVLTPIAAIAGLWYHITQIGVTWVEPVLFVIWYFACGLSITVGYHRLFSHRSHEASWRGRSRTARSIGAQTTVSTTGTQTHQRTPIRLPEDSGGATSFG
jgi:stearoyl-CoA desaturase (delta-9 desaturase)